MLRRLAPLLVAWLGALGTARASDPVVIVSPTDGAVVPTEFTVEVTFGDVTICHCDSFPCDSETCIDAPAEQVTLWAKDSGSWTCDPCDGNSAKFAVMLAPGTYELGAHAKYQYAYSEPSVPVTVTVVDAATTGGETTSATTGDGATTEAQDPVTSSTGTGALTDSASDTSDESPVEKDACACDSRSTTGDVLAWFGAVCLFTRPRRRERAT